MDHRLLTALLVVFVCCQCGLSSKHNELIQHALQDHNDAGKGNVVVAADRGSGDQTVGINWNRVLDFVLDLARKDILRLGMDSVDLPDINEEFKNKVLLVPVKGLFTADNGSLHSLSTVQRTGDTQVKRNGTKFLISCQVGLATLGMKYGHYRARVHHVGSVSGHIKGEVGANSIKVTATVDVKEGRCTASLNDVKVVELEGLRIKVSGSGFGPLNWLITKATNSYAKNHKEEIIEKIEVGLRTEIGKALKDFNCQQYTVLLLL